MLSALWKKSKDNPIWSKDSINIFQKRYAMIGSSNHREHFRKEEKT